MKKTLEDLFQEGLEAADQGLSIEEFLTQHPDVAAELRPLLQLTEQMSKVMAVEPSPEAKAVAHNRILAHAKERPQNPFWLGLMTMPFSWLAPLSGLSRATATAALSALLLSAVSMGAVAASASSLPGDLLYPVKTTRENVQLALTFDEAAKANAYAQLALQRTEELAELSKRDRPITPQALRALTDQTAAAVDVMEKGDDAKSLGQLLLDLTQRQQQVLTDVAAKAPETAQAALQHALEVSQRGQQQAQKQVEEAKERKETPRQRDADTPVPDAEERQRGRAEMPYPTPPRPEQTDEPPAASPASTPHKEKETRDEKEATREATPPATASPEPRGQVDKDKNDNMDNRERRTPVPERIGPTSTPIPATPTATPEATHQPKEDERRGEEQEHEHREHG